MLNKFTEDQIEQMRRELKYPSLMLKRIEESQQIDNFVNATKESFKLQGRDFEKEFNDWKNNL